MEHWPSFITACDAASFVGFLNFYHIYIPYFEQRIAPLRDLTKFEMEMVMVITDLLTPAHKAAKLGMIDAICSDPCIASFDYTKRPYLLTDFPQKEFWL